MMGSMVKVCLLLALSLLFVSGTVEADTLTLANGNTVTGSFVFDATTNAVVSFNFTSNESLNGTTTVWNSTDTAQGANAFISTNPGGDQVFSFFEAQAADLNIADELSLVISCGGVTNCVQQAVDGNSFALTLGTTCPTCNISQVALNVPADLVDDQIVGTSGAFLTIVDPDQLFTLSISPTALGTVYNGANGGFGTGNNGGGGTANTPEPSSLLLMALGLIALFGGKFVKDTRLMSRLSLSPTAQF